MSISRRARPDAQPRWVTAWFTVDAVVALAPPLYWAADGDTTPVFGLPTAVFYFVAVAVCIMASVVAAWLAEARAGETG
jgi:hypothetical protein